MKTCLLAERLCPYCDVDTFTAHDKRIVVHGRQGYRKGCDCDVCLAWYERELEAGRERYRRNSRANRLGVATLARMETRPRS